ncbi:hypothetical protein [Sinomicrobium soli]|uniref:hypothetical protein n=1 Tax=Sinomicrobium sp. N-1-3-6 TaxID=2219864 RepID=UPI000DCB9560|nr:hypothetical protein [Sinomicrobium sp. N-1-3-6]RAV27579.1 hypothetical protein DN748_17995 [Sinomicrobium sp. N-1-3-6]
MVTVRIKENSKQARAFIELIKTFSFVEFIESPEKSEDAKITAFYKKFENAAEEAKAIASGKKKGKPLSEVLDEI